jgi:hypothetical protein
MQGQCVCGQELIQSGLSAGECTKNRRIHLRDGR